MFLIKSIKTYSTVYSLLLLVTGEVILYCKTDNVQWSLQFKNTHGTIKMWSSIASGLLKKIRGPMTLALFLTPAVGMTLAIF